jgi:DNA-binding transcriptional LysR family regulator
MADTQPPAYKELTLRQLRSFCETARLGSFASAAAALDLSHATVLEQVHALERTLGTKLVETHGRGCDLTAAGRLLTELAGPAIEKIATLRERFQEALTQASQSLIVATTPRILHEELSECAATFLARMPKASFSFVEMHDVDILAAIERRDADIGFTPSRPDSNSPTLIAQLAYHLEFRVVTPEDHPLSKLPIISPKDLTLYPIVNAPGAYSAAVTEAMMDRLHGQSSQPHFQVRANYASSIRRFVSLGMGVALLLAHATAPPQPGFFEAPLRDHFGEVPVYAISRRGAYLPQTATDFIQQVQLRYLSAESRRV